MKCEYCKKVVENAHGNRKYCSANCYEKSRYKRTGQRSTPEQRSASYKKRREDPKYVEKINKQGAARHKKVQTFLRKYKLDIGCKECGYNSHHAALEFDHVNGVKKLNVCNSKSINQAKNEIKKCEVVCSNCHKIRTFERLQNPCKSDIFEKTYEEVGEEIQ